MEMEKEQELEWLEAQKIEISVDLVAAAKCQLQFLAAVDRNRYLYEGSALQRAIYRYNACWLPLLAKHSESPIFEGFLVVPLDCEWIWHCHRLNLVRYESDCEELFGKILDNCNVISSVQGICKKQTEEIWNRLYANEPYDFDLTEASLEDSSAEVSGLEKYTKYDLASAVRRQTPFFYRQPSNIIGQRKFSPARDPYSILWDVLWDVLGIVELTYGKKDQQKALPSRLILYLHIRLTEVKEQVRVIKCSCDTHQALEVYSSIERARNTYGQNLPKEMMKKKVMKSYSPHVGTSAK